MCVYVCVFFFVVVVPAFIHLLCFRATLTFLFFSSLFKLVKNAVAQTTLPTGCVEKQRESTINDHPKHTGRTIPYSRFTERF